MPTSYQAFLNPYEKKVTYVGSCSSESSNYKLGRLDTLFKESADSG